MVTSLQLPIRPLTPRASLGLVKANRYRRGPSAPSIAGANFFLMNPAGVVFGPNATINVPGNFAVTTADYIKLTDGNYFYANPTAPETLTTKAVAEYGFLGASRIGKIEFNGSQKTHTTGKSLEFYSGDIAFKGSGSAVGDGAPQVLVNSTARALRLGLFAPRPPVETHSFAGVLWKFSENRWRRHSEGLLRKTGNEAIQQ